MEIAPRAELYVPAGHATQVPFAWYVPGTHALHTLADVAPTAVLEVPSGQSWHSTAPDEGPNEFAGHGKHDDSDCPPETSE